MEDLLRRHGGRCLLLQLAAQEAQPLHGADRVQRDFHSVQDLHTNYVLPAPLRNKMAYLPFQVDSAL
ncbi:hypothetical protein [Streptomyces sp. NPDC054849]